MSKTVWLTTAELAAITERLDYVNRINAGPLGATLADTDAEFAKAKAALDSLGRGDQLFVVAA